MADALFERDTKDPTLFHPTELTRGPWSPDAQHGGPPASLLSALLEAHDSDETPRLDAHENAQPMFVARLTVELLRPVPLTALKVVVRNERRGRKVQLVTATMVAGDKEVARATALRIRRKDLPVPGSSRPALTAPPPPDDGSNSAPPWVTANAQIGFHNSAVDHRFVRGSFAEPGPATDWIRLRTDLIAGEATPDVARVPAAADFGNGVSWTLSRSDDWMFINPDLTIYLHRYPTTPWVCLESETWPQSNGIGLAESRLWDERGVIGRSLQSLLLDRIPG
ncbi:MAG: hypothetical protein ACI8TX_001091 [Hyphomicrobiaceae bacterium]|jgi:hypothetical protein